SEPLINYMNNKNKKVNIKQKKKSSKSKKNIKKQKTFGDPMSVKPLRPVSEYYNLQTGEIYPKIFFRESMWTKIKRFLGLIS
ncbi:hypothetical protein EB118_19445, partial [bacterium]|nr:hypothetical protein [bacterium]